MNWTGLIRASRYILVVALVVCGGFDQVGMGETPDALPLPAAYSLPVLPDPVPQIELTSGQQSPGITFGADGRIIHGVELDPTPRRWLDDLIQIRVGDSDPWAPAGRYRAYPLGVPGASSGSRAMVLLGERVLVFAGTLAGRPEKPLPAEGKVAASIQMDGTDVVVTELGLRRWVFAWHAGIGGWRLSSLTWLRHPQNRIEMRYVGQHLSQIALPNGERIEIAYEQDRPTRIATPFGREALLSYNPEGKLVRIERHLTSEATGSGRVRLDRFDYEYDGSGRLVSLTDNSRVRWNCRYETGGPSDTGTLISRAINDVDQGAIFRYYQVTEDKVHTRVIGASLAGQTIEQAVAAYEFAREKASFTAVGRPSGEVNTRGFPLWLRSALADSHTPVRLLVDHVAWTPAKHQERQKNEADVIEFVRDEHGRITQQKGPDDQNIAYLYSERGDLLEAQVKGEEKPHRFTTDRWGRIVKHERPDRSFREWLFDDVGNLIRIRDAVPLPIDKDDVFAELRFRVTELDVKYDRSGRVTEIQHGDGGRERFGYDARGHLATYNPPSGGASRFVYDRLGRVTRIEQADGSREDVSYYADGRVARHDVRTSGQPWKIVEFDPQGRVTSEQVEGLGKSSYGYDDRGRRNRIVHPNGKDTIYTFDDFNRIIEVRGSAQPPVNISYDKDGNRQVVAVKPK